LYCRTCNPTSHGAFCAFTSRQTGNYAAPDRQLSRDPPLRAPRADLASGTVPPPPKTANIRTAYIRSHVQNTDAAEHAQLRELPVCTACSHAPLAGPIARKTSSATNSDTPYNEDSVKGGPSRRAHLKEVADRATCTGREPLRARQHSHIATNLRYRHSLPPPAVTKGGLSVNQRSAPTPQRAA